MDIGKLTIIIITAMLTIGNVLLHYNDYTR